ncbi:MAG: GAF domain-containing sensor histidine kinase [Acidimicrobiales bacterium]
MATARISGSTSGAVRVVWLAPVVSLLLGVMTVVCTLESPGDRRDPVVEVVLTSLMLPAWAAIGGLIIRRLPRHPVGWIVASVGIVGPIGAAGDAYASVEPALAARDWVYWAASVPASALVPFVAMLFLLFPDGRPLSRRWGVAIALAVAAQTLMVAGGALSEYSAAGEDGFTFGHPWLRNPLGTTISEGHVLWGGGIGWPLFLASLVLAVASFVIRFRRGGSKQRQQLKWLLPPLGLVAAGFLGMELTGSEGTFWLLVPGLMAMPVAIGIAILRNRLFDIDIVIRKSVVYAVLWSAVGALYLAVAALPGLVVGERVPIGAAIGLTVLATLVFQPARRAVDRAVGRMMFGERPTKFELLTRFGETVAETFDVTELAPRVADTVRQGLDLEWARVGLSVGDGATSRTEPAGAAGVALDDPVTPWIALPLTQGEQRLGIIECGPKREGRITDRDHEMLSSLARQAALGIHNARLAAELSARLDEIGRQAAELRASRARLVAAQDTERQRLERDLHDGVQQDVVSLLAQLGLARSQLRRDPVVVEATLAELQSRTGQMLRDLRQLAQGIHPPVLADRGLLEALEARLAHIPIGVQIHADRALRGARFHPDIEAAAYFFVCEGITNAMKHATASRVAVRVTVDGAHLAVGVEDDGGGFVPARTTGSGLTGLRDRVEAVGGEMQLLSSPGAGTRLGATLPLGDRVAQETS